MKTMIKAALLALSTWCVLTSSARAEEPGPVTIEKLFCARMSGARVEASEEFFYGETVRVMFEYDNAAPGEVTRTTHLKCDVVVADAFKKTVAEQKEVDLRERQFLGQACYASVFIEIPKVEAGAFTVTLILTDLNHPRKLSDAKSCRIAVKKPEVAPFGVYFSGDPDGAFPMEAETVSATQERVFLSGKILGVDQIVKAPGKLMLTLRYQLLDADGKLIAEDPRALDGSIEQTKETLSYYLLFRIPVDLPARAGKYTVQVTGKLSIGSEKTEISFSRPLEIVEK